MHKNIDYSLYLVTDRQIIGNRSLIEIVTAAIQGGVSIVQVREKDCSTREFIELARELMLILRPRGIPLIINDRVDVALAAGCDGVHIGQSDMPYPDARRIMGPDAIIGLSVENMEQVAQADAWDVDYLGVSPVFDTPTKTDTAPAWGLEGLHKIRSYSRHPLIAIGGLNAGNVADVIKNGAHGIALVSAIMGATDPESAAREIRGLIDEAGSQGEQHER